LSQANPPLTIAIDGPAASGKTTIGRLLADVLGYLFFDTGLMYRAVTWAAIEGGADTADEAAVVALATGMQLKVLPPTGATDGRSSTVLVDGHDVTWQLRSPAVDANVSRVSSYAEVRRLLVARQREIAARGRVVMVGRDIGTVVIPDAPLKLYIIASPEERARRRWQERLGRAEGDDFAAILADVERRDAIDAGRQHSPMRPADDAIVLDTTGRSPAQVLADILALAPFRPQAIAG
jgi:cytidylate kinase